jgi:hypothetical protein
VLHINQTGDIYIRIKTNLVNPIFYYFDIIEIENLIFFTKLIG